MSRGPVSGGEVIATYLWIAGSYSFAASLTAGINTLFLLDAGFDIFEVFVVNAAFTASIALFEIPTGVLADTAGRRLSVLASLAALFVGVLGYTLAARLGLGIGAFVPLAAILGLGTTFASGSLEAWLVDALADDGHEGDLAPVFARAQIVGSVATVAAMVLGATLASRHMQLPYLLRAAVLLPLTYVVLTRMHERRSRRPRRASRGLYAEATRAAGQALRVGWHRKEARSLLLVSVFQYGFLTWAFHAWQPYVLDMLGSDAVWVAGVVAAFIALAAVAGSALVPTLCRRWRPTTILLGGAAISVATALVLGLEPGFAVAVALLATLSLATAVSGAVKQAYLHRIVPSRHRATLISCDSLLGNGGGMAGQLGLGAVARGAGIGPGYLAGAGLAAAAVPILALLRGRAGDEDRPSEVLPRR